MTRLFVLLLSVALLSVGCGSDKKESGPAILPRAETAAEWAIRVVDGVMRPTNRDIEVLATLNNPQTKLLIEQGNETTLNVLNTRMNDLGKCSDRLVTIGPPPPTGDLIHRLRRVHGALRRACVHYVKVSETVLVAVKLMSSGRTDVIERGEDKLREAGPDAVAGAKAYDQAFKIAVTIPEFQLHGVRPPA